MCIKPIAPFFDPRYSLQLKAGLIAGLTAALFYTAAAGVSMTNFIAVGVVLFFCLSTLPCLFIGIWKRSINALNAFCCGSGSMLFFAIVSILSVYTFDKPRLECVCNPACTSLPSNIPRNPVVDIATLRNSTLYANELCPRESSVLSSYASFVALALVGMIFLSISCALMCTVRGKWVADEALLRGPDMDQIMVVTNLEALGYGHRPMFNPYASSSQLATFNSGGIPMATYSYAPQSSIQQPQAPQPIQQPEAPQPIQQTPSGIPNSSL